MKAHYSASVAVLVARTAAVDSLREAGKPQEVDSLRQAGIPEVDSPEQHTLVGGIEDLWRDPPTLWRRDADGRLLLVVVAHLSRAAKICSATGERANWDERLRTRTAYRRIVRGENPWEVFTGPDAACLGPRETNFAIGKRGFLVIILVAVDIGFLLDPVRVKNGDSPLAHLPAPIAPSPSETPSLRRGAERRTGTPIQDPPRRSPRASSGRGSPPPPPRNRPSTAERKGSEINGRFASASGVAGTRTPPSAVGIGIQSLFEQLCLGFVDKKTGFFQMEKQILYFTYLCFWNPSTNPLVKPPFLVILFIYRASKDDITVHSALSAAPSSDYVNASRWYNHIEALLSGVSVEGQGIKVERSSTVTDEAPASPPVVDSKASAAEDEDDDVDLFGEETEEEKKAAEDRAAAAKASGKKKDSGKSSVLLDVKPWDDETDMQKLEEAVRNIKMEGLLWGASKLVPVGYGIKKLQIMLTIVDDLVSVDNLIEDHLTAEPANEHIQSCDIVAFNKISHGVPLRRDALWKLSSNLLGLREKRDVQGKGVVANNGNDLELMLWRVVLPMLLVPPTMVAAF
ncbi:Elongation factor 1-delta [Apostasia shenzhenica]|uniref:Elongation factor 1-delta n=1 Tax=Apostasia shenzhenica TaxID=1088818 RepID=A0A2I0A2M7_9ASPA|nr:Elongation factor 1-delta [Apostasia shenzhenica]